MGNDLTYQILDRMMRGDVLKFKKQFPNFYEIELRAVIPIILELGYSFEEMTNEVIIDLHDVCIYFGISVPNDAERKLKDLENSEPIRFEDWD